jgi:hypothetical protein
MNRGFPEIKYFAEKSVEFQTNKNKEGINAYQDEKAQCTASYTYSALRIRRGCASDG